MSTPVRSLIPQVCPQCGGEKTLTISAARTTCRRCGFILREGGVDQKPTPPPPVPMGAISPRDLTQYVVSYRIRHPGGVPGFVEAAYHTALDYLHRQQWDDAKRALHRCIEYQSDFLDAHLWLGRILEDIDKRREHYRAVLAYDPRHPEALRELMILNGELTLPAGFNEYTMPEVVDTGGAVVETRNKGLRCPRCNSPRMDADPITQELYCEYCGYSQPQGGEVGVSAGAGGFLTQALLKRRSQPIQWKVGARLLNCNSCGAQRTLPPNKLSDVCPFCDSRNVIESDALGSFQQPDSLIPFRVSPRRAESLVQEQLSSRRERLRGWFVDNRVERIGLEGVFLPFWMFDTILEVRRTIIDQRREDNRYSSTLIPYQTETIADMMSNVPVPAVKSPPRQLINRAGRFNLKKAVPYKSDYLAQFSAEFYAIDFDTASMDVQEIVGGAMRQKYGARTSNERQVNIFTLISQMIFTLVLVPVWVVTVYEKDGDIRPGLVNGQTGQVAMGKARKPQG